MTRRNTKKPSAAKTSGKLRQRKKSLRVSETSRITRYFHDIISRTSLLQAVCGLVILWLLFSAGLYVAETSADEAVIDSYWDALYWGIAAFSTAGIADTPSSVLAKLVGGLWIITGSVIFFGTIVAAVTGYFLRPVQPPVDQIVDMIEFNLEQLEELSVDELDLLKKTTDALILHIERLNAPKKAS